MSICPSVAENLVQETRLFESGYGKNGFQASEQRLTLGGKVWRSWKPRQKSKLFGKEYESWEWSGSVSHAAAVDLAGKRCRPSRVDLAWDYSVDPDRSPDDVVEVLKDHARRRNIKIGIRGEDDRNTRYIGTRKSTRQIRIYRRDWLHPSQYSGEGPTLRVELVLRQERAHAWWPMWCEDQREAWQAGAQHVYEMTGLLAQPDRADIPPIAVRVDSDERHKFEQFLLQHGTYLSALLDEGLDIGREVMHYEEKRDCRLRRSRRNQKRLALQQAALVDILDWDSMRREDRALTPEPAMQ